MGFSLMKNDKSTFVDEIILGLISVVCLAVGILLIKIRPEFWIIEEHITGVLGVMITLTGVMFLPCLIYRLFTNELPKK